MNWRKKKRGAEPEKKRKKKKGRKKEALNQKRKGRKKDALKGWNRTKRGLKLKGRGAETERQRLNWEDWDEIYFQHLFSFESPQKNDGEFVYVEFNF